MARKGILPLRMGDGARMEPRNPRSGTVSPRKNPPAGGFAMTHACLAALAALALALPGTAAALSEPSGLDGRLRVTSDEDAALLLSGARTHIYTCRALGTDPDTPSSGLAAPDPTLRDAARTSS